MKKIKEMVAAVWSSKANRIAFILVAIGIGACVALYEGLEHKIFISQEIWTLAVMFVIGFVFGLILSIAFSIMVGTIVWAIGTLHDKHPKTGKLMFTIVILGGIAGIYYAIFKYVI